MELVTKVRRSISTRENRRLFYFLAMSGLQRAVPFLVLPLFTRTLGAEGYGHASVLVSLYVLTGFITTLGQETVLYRFGHGYRNGNRSHADQFKRSTWTLAIAPWPWLILLTVFSAVNLIGELFPVATYLPIVLTIAGAALSASAVQFLGTWFRLHQMDRQTFSLAMTTALSFSAFKLAFVVGLDLGVLGWGISDLLAGIALYAYAYPRMRKVWKGTARVTLWRVGHVLRLGVGVVPGKSSNWVVGLSDRLIVIALLGAAIAGQYALAAQSVAIASILITEASKFLLPQLNDGRNPNEQSDKLRKVAHKQLFIVSLIIFITAICVEFMPHIFGDEYSGAVKIGSWLTISLLITGINYLYSDILAIVVGATAKASFGAFLGAVMAIGANLLLIPPLGIYGAVVAAVLSAMTTHVVLAMAVRRSLGRSLFSWQAYAMTVVLITGLAGCSVVRMGQ